MALIVNGVTIPTSGDFIKIGNTNVDKVVCNGVTVWEKVKDINVFTPGGGVNPNVPYTIHNIQPKSTKCNCGSDKEIIHVASGEITVSSSDITIATYHEYPGDPRHNGMYGSKYIQFVYDLSSFRTIEASISIYAETSVDNDQTHKFSIKVLNASGTLIKSSNEVGGTASHPFESYDETPINKPLSYAGTVTLDVSAINENCFIQFNDKISCDCRAAGGHGTGYVRITSIKFNS